MCPRCCPPNPRTTTYWALLPCTRLVLAKHNILATLIPIAAGRPKSVLAMAQRQEVSQIKRPKTPDNIKQAVMSVDPIATTRQRRLTAIAFRRIESHVVELRKAVKVRARGSTCTLLLAVGSHHSPLHVTCDSLERVACPRSGWMQWSECTTA